MPRIYGLVFAAMTVLPLTAGAGAAGTDMATAATPDPTLVAVVNGDWRDADAKARDKYRHPVESLTFWPRTPSVLAAHFS